MSKHNGVLVRDARDHVFTLFRAAEDVPLEYHHFARTRETVDACKEIIKGSKLDAEARDVALLCAWFYDACYATGRDDHDKSLELCVRFLDEQHARHPTHDQIAACFGGVDGVERAAPGGAAPEASADRERPSQTSSGHSDASRSSTPMPTARASPSSSMALTGR